MVIIGLVGILTTDTKIKMWDHLGPAFLEQFKGSRFVLEQAHYNVLSMCTVRTFKDAVVAKYDTGEDVLLVGHSMGGVHACAIEPQFKKSKVVGVVTLNSPHRLLGGIFSWLAGCKPLTAPVVSFAATKDRMVPWGAKHPQAVRHVVFCADHEYDLITNRGNMAQQIADIASAAIQKARRN